MGVAQGKKVSSDGVAAQTIEAEPVFGQIEPSKRPRASACWTTISGEDLASLGFNAQEVGMFRGKERNNVQETALLSADK